MNNITKLKNKIEFNNNLLKETIENICFGTNIDPNFILKEIKNNNNLKNIHVKNLNDNIYSKIYFINEEYNKIQSKLNYDINIEKSNEYLNKINYNNLHIFKEEMDFENPKTINGIKDIFNDILTNLYKSKKINLNDLLINPDGLLVNDKNNNNILNFIFDKNFNTIHLKDKIDENISKKLSEVDLIIIHQIQNDFKTILEMHFERTKEFDSFQM